MLACAAIGGGAAIGRGTLRGKTTVTLPEGGTLTLENGAFSGSVNIAELEANAHVKQATGDSEAVRLRAIGEILDTTEEAAKNCLFRATQKMRAVLGDFV